jgi:hypothetical protein
MVLDCGSGVNQIIFQLELPRREKEGMAERENHSKRKLLLLISALSMSGLILGLLNGNEKCPYAFKLGMLATGKHRG